MDEPILHEKMNLPPTRNYIVTCYENECRACIKCREATRMATTVEIINRYYLSAFKLAVFAMRRLYLHDRLLYILVGISFFFTVAVLSSFNAVVEKRARAL